LSPYLFGFYDSERDDTRTPFASSAIAGRIESAVWQYQDEPYFFEFCGKKKGAPFLDVGGIFCFFVKFSEKIFCFTEIKKKKFDDFSFEPEEICATTDCARRQEADSLFVLFLSPSRFLVDFNKRMAPPLSYK
jgi:hypothetical protein